MNVVVLGGGGASWWKERSIEAGAMVMGKFFSSNSRICFISSNASIFRVVKFLVDNMISFHVVAR